MYQSTPEIIKNTYHMWGQFISLLVTNKQTYKHSTLCISTDYYYGPPLIGGVLSDAFVWRLSVAYIGPNWRTEA